MPVPTPLVVYAPLQPVLLAVGGQNPVGTARVEDTIFFTLTVLIVGLVVVAVTDELWLAAAAQLIIGSSLAINVASLGTDGTALFFAIVALVAIMRFRDRHGGRWLRQASAKRASARAGLAASASAIPSCRMACSARILCTIGST